MKRTITTLTILLLTLVAVAQKKVNITGIISEPIDSKVIVVNASSTDVVAEPKQEQLKLDSNGRFKVEVPVKEKYNWIIVVHGNKRIDFMAEAGSQLTLHAVGAQFDTAARFSGKGSEIPTFFVRYIRERGGIMAFLRKAQDMAALEPLAYEQAMDSLLKAEEQFAEQQSAGLPKTFLPYWKENIRFAAYDALLNYPAIHEMIKQRSNNIQQVPLEHFSQVKNVPMVMGDQYLSQNFYQSYATNYYTAQLSAQGYSNNIAYNPSTQTEDRSQAFRQTDSVLQILYTKAPPKTAELVAGRILAAGAKSWKLEELEQRVAGYKKRYPKGNGVKTLEHIIYEAKKFSPGQPAVDFTFTTLDGKEMKLSDLKGKVVYMDFWASWCGPCKGEMPHAKKIKEHFQDKDVVFLYVSIDDKEDAWKRGIEAMSISGVHTRTPGWGGPIAQLYKIRSVPAYFLIDKKGNFALDHTPRPSQSADLIKEIEHLLQ